MAFPVELASTLTGATVWQLNRWRQDGLLIPEVQDRRPPLYSFRDLVALRTVVWLKRATSLQRVRRALAHLDEFDLTDHPAAYTFATDGRTIAVDTPDGLVDLLQRPGQGAFSLADVYLSFRTTTGRLVPDFRRPRAHLEVNARRLGGWPTIADSRVPFDTIAELVEDESVGPRDVARFYPSVSEEAVRDAVDFAADVRSRRRAAG
ncbi:DUF433 domain-containing protein [Cellulomonas cellasea]|uniref:Uncharacterized protein (DUF433 family) n=1 Tax=Cellulomonas cellasea TaxID=43670 RepID=A0A7W4Y9S7_9CELL|nr:DUF433 domain-containing protein [Cellulomonas cellasea]MBB2921279.1 uncharacterized protein (DUF433 family) [Cellulomonas cellasea]